MLLRVSEMVCELPQLREMDINPIIVDESGAVAVDARIVIDSAPQALGSLGRQLPAPGDQAVPGALRTGLAAARRRRIHACARSTPTTHRCCRTWCTRISPESRYFRFVSSITELPPSMLARFTLIDYDREMALVAVFKERSAGADGEIVETERIVGVSRYITNPDQSSCEFALRGGRRASAARAWARA